MESTKKTTNKYQHKLIVLISTINYMNLMFKKYTQNYILYYFNNNMKKNGYKPAKIKTLQNYLYKLEKVFKVTMNYHRHLGVNMGTEIHYTLKYSKKECYHIINKYFKEKKDERHRKRVNAYIEKTFIKNSNVEKWECYNNNYNKIEEKQKDVKSIEKLQIKKYARKCNFKSNTFFSILNLELEKNAIIEILKAFKKTEDFFTKDMYKKKISATPKTNRLKNKQQKLKKILNETKINLESEGYNNTQLKIQIQNVYEKYKYKPHFIVENYKYNDLEKVIEKLKKSVKLIKETTKDNENNIKNNMFSILLDQLKNKADMSVLIPTLKDYLRKKDKLEYNKLFSNYYYYELLKLINNYYYLSTSKGFEKTSVKD